MSTSASAETATAPQPRASVWEDFADIFISPTAVFTRRRDGKFGLALLVLTIVLAVLTWVWFDAMEPVMTRQFATAMDQARQQNPNLTEEQIAQMRGFGTIIGKVGAIIMVPLTVFLIGLATWLIGKIFGAKATLGTAMMIATYSQFPRILKTLVEAVQGMFMDPAALDSFYRPTLSLGRFLDPDQTSMRLIGLAGRIDVFVIWMTVLLGIGMYVAGGASKRNAGLIALVVWLLGGLGTVAFVR